MRLEQLQAEFGDAITVVWRSFLLRPEAKPGGRPMDRFTEYTTNWARPADLEPGARFRVPWSGEHEPPSHSVPSAIGGKVAQLFGADVGAAFRMRLFEAYFGEHRTISRRSVLREVAIEAGIDGDAYDTAWNTYEDDLVRRVLEDHTTAVQSEVTGVPAVVIDRTYLLPGALDLEQYRKSLHYVLSRRETTPESEGTA